MVCESPAGGGVIEVTGSVTEDGVERALAGAGAGVTGGAWATHAARALLRVTGGLGATVVVSPGGTGQGAAV